MYIHEGILTEFSQGSCFMVTHIGSGAKSNQGVLLWPSSCEYQSIYAASVHTRIHVQFWKQCLIFIHVDPRTGCYYSNCRSTPAEGVLCSRRSTLYCTRLGHCINIIILTWSTLRKCLKIPETAVQTRFQPSSPRYGFFNKRMLGCRFNVTKRTLTMGKVAIDGLHVILHNKKKQDFIPNRSARIQASLSCRTWLLW